MKTYGQDEYVPLDQDILKTSSEDEDERRLQDVLIKTNVWWDTVGFVKLLFGCPTADFGLLSRE